MGILDIGEKPLWDLIQQTPGQNIHVIKVLDAVAITGSGNSLSDAIELNLYRPTGFFSIQITTAGAGSTVKIEYLLSMDGTVYSDCGTDIKTGFAPGTNIFDFPAGEPSVAPFMKLKVSEETGNNITSCTLLLSVL